MRLRAERLSLADAAVDYRDDFGRSKRRLSSGSVSKSASMKISTVSSLEWISTRTGASPKSTSWRRPFSRRIIAWGISASLSAISGNINGDDGKWYKARRGSCHQEDGSPHLRPGTERHTPTSSRRCCHDRMVPGGSRKRCMKTRSSQRPNLWPTSLKWATRSNPRRS